MEYCVAIALLLSLWYLGVVLLLRRGLGRLGGPGTPAGLRFSVVIAARNEQETIEACLHSILDQSISPERYQVIVVDDRSQDATAERVHAIARHHGNVKLVQVTEPNPKVGPKKNAVLQGITSAGNEIIVFTDADCRVPRRWLETIDRWFSEYTGLVQGITAYQRAKGMSPLFWGLQSLDFLSHGVVAAGAIGAKVPLNSNANNLAIRRDAFEDIGGYGESSKVVAGDDDILLQRIWKHGKWRVRFMADPEAAVETLPTPNVAGVINQRMKWGSITVHYGPRQVALLGGIFAFYCATVAALLSGIFSPALLATGAGMLALKLLGETLLLFPGTRLFGKAALRRYTIPASLIQLPVVILAVVAGVFGSFGWKGESLRRTR